MTTPRKNRQELRELLTATAFGAAPTTEIQLDRLEKYLTTEISRREEEIEPELRQKLYRLGNKLVFNQRAVDEGNITPQQRDEMNMRCFDEVLAVLRPKLKDKEG